MASWFPAAACITVPYGAALQMRMPVVARAAGSAILQPSPFLGELAPPRPSGFLTAALGSPQPMLNEPAREPDLQSYECSRAPEPSLRFDRYRPTSQNTGIRTRGRFSLETLVQTLRSRPGLLTINEVAELLAFHPVTLQSPLIAGMIETSAPVGTAVGSTRRPKLSAVNEAIREYIDAAGAD